MNLRSLLKQDLVIQEVVLISKFQMERISMTAIYLRQNGIILRNISLQIFQLELIIIWAMMN